MHVILVIYVVQACYQPGSVEQRQSPPGLEDQKGGEDRGMGERVAGNQGSGVEGSAWSEQGSHHGYVGPP